jgi:hypothetical protein
VAVTADSRDWFLLNASPDLLRQIESTPELHPAGESRHTPIAAVALSAVLIVWFRVPETKPLVAKPAG